MHLLKFFSKQISVQSFCAIKRIEKQYFISMFRDTVKPDSVVPETYTYFQGQHTTWQCGPWNLILFSGPAWNLAMWSLKPNPIFRASMEPDNVVPETYSLKGIRSILSPDILHALATCGWKVLLIFIKIVG